MLVNLLGFDRLGLQEYCASLGEKTFRANQLLQWVHKHLEQDLEKMTNLSKNLRAQLHGKCEVALPEVVSEHVASDETRKWVFKVPGGSLVETVFIPELKRGTLCISSQVGCALTCSFCSTAKQGFNRNLSTAEIIGQVYLAQTLLRKVTDVSLSTTITNVVFMGMGEPLLNYEPVKAAISLLRDELAYELPKRRVTVSTSGVVPMIYKLADEMDAALAISLHAPNDELRNELVPINRKYNIASLLEACEYYNSKSVRNFCTMEYVMLRGINDKPEHAKQLKKILSNIRCKINLIPFNPFPNSGYECSTRDQQLRFQQSLKEAGFVVTIRKTRGQDIDAACGQLVGKVIDRTSRQRRHLEKYAALESQQS